ncbi:MAG: sulfur carrier protein ThiS [Acidimicrobiales bacterium]
MASTIIVNGKTVEVNDGATMTDLFAQLDLDAKWVVTERNGMPVARTETSTTVLVNGDRVELVKAVAGG